MSILQDFSSTPYSDRPRISPPPSNASPSNQHSSAIPSEKQRPIQVIYPNGLTYEGLSVNGSLQGKGRIIECGGRKVTEVNFQPQGRVVINHPNGITKKYRIIKGHLVTEEVGFPSGNVFRGRMENENLGEGLKTVLKISRQETPPLPLVTRAVVSPSPAKIKSENRKEEEFEERRRIERDKFLIAEVKKRHRQMTREKSSKNLLAEDLQQPPSIPPSKETRSRGDKICSFFHRIRLYK